VNTLNEMNVKSLIVTCACIFSFSVIALADDYLPQGDMCYSNRAVNFNSQNMKVDPEFINKAIMLYQQGFEETTGAIKEEACWKLIRACFFKGQYVAGESEEKKRTYDIGKNIGAEGLELFPESVAIHTWMAIIWGVWGEEFGIFRSAREGVAGRIRQHCEKVIELDAAFQDAAGYRVLGRLNFKAPKIPIILGWPSKEKALEYLGKAHRMAPENLYTKQYLAEALYNRGNKNRAIELMKEIIATSQLDQGIVEDTFIKKRSNEILNQWNDK
jgi:tetratricopeptide (TPR) repeat protein